MLVWLHTGLKMFYKLKTPAYAQAQHEQADVSITEPPACLLTLVKKDMLSKTKPVQCLFLHECSARHQRRCLYCIHAEWENTRKNKVALIPLQSFKIPTNLRRKPSHQILYKRSFNLFIFSLTHPEQEV